MCPSSSSLSSMVGGDEGGSSVYSLNCSVCKGEFSRRDKWMEHLTLEDHQNLTRECLQNDMISLKECSLMVFTTYDLTAEVALKIIQYFWRDQAVWVTDFWWWEERPRFAVVQFESRKKVEEVLRGCESFPGENIQIDNQGIQVKGAFDLLDLEWKALLPGTYPAPIIPPLQSSQKAAEKNEASISGQNDKQHRSPNSTTEETGEETEVNLRETEEDDSTNYVKLLFDLAEERKWRPPILKFDQVKTSNQKTKYLCTVLLNGQVYKPHSFTGRAKKSEEAQKLAAKFCLEALKSSKEVDQEQEENSNIEASNNPVSTPRTSPIAILRALSRKLYGIPPEFRITRNQELKNSKYFCSVYLNGVNRLYTSRGETAEEAKIKSARFWLEKLKRDDGIEAQKYLSAPQSHLSYQFFTVISEFVEIPEEKGQRVVEIVRSFRNVLRTLVPSTQVIVFRNWYLKLRNSPAEKDEPLFIYIYAEDEMPSSEEENGVPSSSPRSSEDNGFTWLPGKIVEEAINKSELFLRVENEKTFPDPDDPQETRLGCEFLHKPSGIPFTVVNFKRTMVEVQCCRLVKYFCQFDPRVRPLLILARYWMITNGIHWGEPEVSARTSHQCLPEPHTLDWMILTFLMGENYVPSLRTILTRSHKVIVERATATDVGFSADMDFAREWKKKKGFKTESADQFILATLQLFQNFLDFCSTTIFDQGGAIINPKDGEVLEASKFLSGDFTSELTTEEISVLMKQFQDNSVNDIKGKYCVDYRRWNWYMIHPLVTNWRFSVPARNEELPLITSTKKTSERLKNLLKLVESEGAEKAFQICGASLCEILKVDKEIPVIDTGHPRPSRKRPIKSLEDEIESPSTKKKIKIRKEPQPGQTLVTFYLEKSPPLAQGDDETALAYQLYSLLEESVVIPDNQYDKVLQAVNFLQGFFQNNDSSCKVSLFRRWNLKLKQFQDDPENMPFVYLYSRKPCEETKSDFTLLSFGKIWWFLNSLEVKARINILEGPTPMEGEDPSKFKTGWTLECKGFGGNEAEDEEKSFKLCLFSSHNFLFEVKTCGLLEYMCKFDGRAYQMIKMAYFWMGVNKLSLEEACVVDEDGAELSSLSLDWLVIFWMCHSKMVPSPREIQERGRGNHKVIREGETGVDLGWEEDDQYLEEWRVEKNVKDFEWRGNCVLRLLQVFGEFLKFCGWLGQQISGRNLVLNTRNGEVSGMRNFMKCEFGRGKWCKNMSEEEAAILRAQVVNVKDCKIYMTHPLNMQWRFGLRNDIEPALKLMKEGGIRLKTYLHLRRSNGEEAAMERFKSLRNVLTLTDTEFSKCKHN